MKTKTNLLFNLILVLGIILATWPSGAQAETAPQPTSPIQPPEPTSKDQDEQAWETLPPEIKAKIDPRILDKLQPQALPAHLKQADVAPGKPPHKTRFLVYLKTQADLKTLRQQTFANRLAQRTAVFDTLVNTAQATQGALNTLLQTRMSQGNVAAYQPFYIFNGFAVEGDLKTIIELAQRDDVARIVANYPLIRYENSGTPVAMRAEELGGLSPDNWNIDLVDAERVWNEFGITGQGAVVANIDTGVDHVHPALANQYRGNLGGGDLVHDYNWFDPDPNLYPGGDLGPSRTETPFDYGDHGTHTMGTMVGDGGDPGTQVGMAPGARWIAISLNELYVESSLADDIMAHKAFQWMLCPTDLSGALASADCSRAPDVVNNSWGSANPADDTFRPDIQALRAAGIAPVFASGNPSAGPGSIGAPGNAPEAITVGATDADDEVASFSGRGPSFYPGEQKPELSAPGVAVKSTIPQGGYDYYSGTSMAAPHVAGLIALVVSADLQDGIRHLDVNDLERFMTHTAADLGEPGPDDDHGYGRIDAYSAVRWARSAGDLRGVVRDAGTGSPIQGATILGVRTTPPDIFSGQTDPSGQYSVTVPAGGYDVTVGAWGHYSETFSAQLVITGSLSVADFALTAMPTAPLTGRVLRNAKPISGALVYVAAQPAVHWLTKADGTYTLTLPVGMHAIVVKAPGHRILRGDTNVAENGSTHNLSMTPAPTILLVDADVHWGWFAGWPLHNYFQWSLDEENYLYDTWPIQDINFNDTQEMPDGSIRYGIPSASTLYTYDLVLWAHAGGSPNPIGAADELTAYLDGGGRLILSGQDIGYHDYNNTWYRNYIHADHTIDNAAGEGDSVSGQSFLSGLNPKITNASLYGYANGTLGLWPDAVVPRDGAAFPVLTYDNGAGVAALAIAPCDASYRAVYFALGYENIAPRAEHRDPAIADVLDRSIAWVTDKQPAYGASVTATPSFQTNEPGSSVTYDLQVANRGRETTTFELTLSNNAWPTRILSDTNAVTLTLDLAPCSLQDLSIHVDIPATANAGDQDTVTLTALPHHGVAGASSDNSVTITTAAFPAWQREPNAPFAASRVALAGWENSVYLMGGEGSTTENYEFNACSGQWIAREPIPLGVRNHAAAAMDGKIYVTGGNTDTAADNLQIYDVASDSWSDGAPMPQARWAHAAIALDGEVYVVGGLDDVLIPQATALAYNPASDSWRTIAPMSNPRYWVAGAALNGKLYVVGGVYELDTVEEYDPSTDTWTTRSPMLDGRAAPGATSADGYLYVAGGGFYNYQTASERYDPSTDAWEPISNLNIGRRTLGMAYAAGKLFVANGWRDVYSNELESLRLNDTFCLSNKHAWQNTVQPGDRITYTVHMYSDPTPLASASLVDPIPAGATFGGFGDNPIGATYNSAADQVQWSGAIPPNAEPLTFSFDVNIVAADWMADTPITNAITFDSGAGLVFSRTAITSLDFPSASPSVKKVDKSQTLAGDVLTYTIRVQNSSNIDGAFTLHDPIPANTTYVPGSLTSTVGAASYDPLANAITWAETLPPPGGYANTGDDHEWGDSDNNGTIPGVTFEWIDISGTGVNAGIGDDYYYCYLPIGFTYNFYDTAETHLCASTNGFVSFDTWGYSDLSNDCPLPSFNGNGALIAGVWDDLITQGGIYYQTFGKAPNRYLVVQWHNVRHYGSIGSYFDFEIILYEGGGIQVQLLDAGAEQGRFSTTGIEDYGEAQGLTYACSTASSIHDNLAIVFLPPGGTVANTIANVSFAVATESPLPVNTKITNTAIITAPYGAVERSASTAINPIDLGDSRKQTDKAQAQVGEIVTYDFFLQNSGLLTATDATLTDPLPQDTTYVPGSLACGSGSCDHASGIVTWNGDLPPGDPVTLTFAVALSTSLPNLTPVTNTATLHNGAADLYALEAVFQARSSSLSASFKRATPSQAAPGSDVIYTVYVYNSGTGSTTGEMRDKLPPELTFVPGSLVCGTGSCAYASGVITWTGTLIPHLLVPVKFHATVSASATHEALITNSAIITDLGWMTAHPATAKVTVSKAADLWLTQDGTWAKENGATYIYTLTYGNDGPHDADSPAQINDVLPAGATYVGSTPEGIYSPTLGVVTWDVGTLRAGISGTLTMSVKSPTGTLALIVLTNTASISSIPQDPNTANNKAVLIARSPDLSASFKQAHPTQATPGRAITYTITMYNSGVMATAGHMQDKLPPELTFVPGSLVCSGGTGSCGQASGVITWTGTVGPQATAPVQFQALAPTSPGHTHLITNTAIVTDLAWGIGSPVVAQVLKAADLWVSKNGNSIIQDGATLVYTLTYGNAGPYDANSPAQVLDVLPAGVTYVGSTPPGMYDPTARTVTWNVGGLQADISGTLTANIFNTLLLSVEVPAGTAPLTRLTNTVNISAIPQDPNAANNADKALTIVNLFHPAKTASPSQLSSGDVVTYTITLANGDDVTVTASLTDPIPAGAVYLPGSSTVNGVSTELYNDVSQSIEWQGAVPPNSTTTLRLQAQITATCATIVNSVRVKHIEGMISSRQATLHVVPCSIYLPILTKLYHQ